MPRIIVTTHPSQPSGVSDVLFDEDVYSVHLSTSHGAGQLVERLAWAVRDAEDAETRRERHTAPGRRLAPLHLSPAT
jgi:hypothetical protein